MTTTTQTASTKVCPNCSSTFQAGGRGLGKTFCSTDCRTSFNNRSKAEGAVMANLVKAWIANRHAKPGTKEAAICSYARSELTAIAGLFNSADKDEGRDATAYVASLMASQTFYMDRTQKA